MSSSLLSNVLGTKLPGPGCIYKKQDFKFLKPVFIGDTIEANVEVLEINKKENEVKFKTWCVNQKGQNVVEGFACIIPVNKKVKENKNGCIKNG